MKNQLLEKFEMKTNFEGLIKLLAKNLYSEPNVFIRELIQNAHDSIVRRQIKEAELAGHIDVHINRDESKIVFLDNGIGMDEDDIKNFLSVIGSTGTGTTREEHLVEGLDFNLIGQFGIGMLSAFVVAQKVIVRTKKADTDKAFAWHNSGSTDCYLYHDEKQQPGTEISIFVSEDYKFVLNEEYIQEAIKKYCDFIPFPITINNQGTANIMNAPWHKEYIKSEEEKKAEYELFLKRRYKDLVLDIIPIEIDDIYKAKGVLYISDAILPDIITSGIVDIFVRRMFVRAGDREILPEWAKFVQGIIDSPDLKPTAARDNIQRNEAAYEFIKSKLGDIIVEHLIRLSQKEQAKFKKINKLHHYHLKGMAAAHHQFFEKVGHLLLFETNKGQLSLQEIVKKNTPRKEKDDRKPVYYFTSGFSAPQFFSLADAKEWVVINAAAIFEEPLIEKYAQINATKVYLERLDTSDDPKLFKRLTDEENEFYNLLELETESVLKNAGIDRISVRTRKFAPADLPSILITTAETEAEQKLRQLMNNIELLGFDEIAVEAYNTGRKSPVYLTLNASNALIQHLAKTDSYKSMDKKIRGIVLMGLYNSTLLYSQDMLDSDKIKQIHEHFIQMIQVITTGKM